MDAAIIWLLLAMATLFGLLGLWLMPLPAIAQTPRPGVPTNSALLLTNITVDDVGNYLVVVTNQFGSATSATAALTVTLPPEISWQLTSNGFQVSAQTVPGLTFEVQAATNLNPPVVWTMLATNQVDANGLARFTETNSVASPARFYRVVFP